jgi:hypothetical protein
MGILITAVGVLLLLIVFSPLLLAFVELAEPAKCPCCGGPLDEPDAAGHCRRCQGTMRPAAARNLEGEVLQ